MSTVHIPEIEEMIELGSVNVSLTPSWDRRLKPFKQVTPPHRIINNTVVREPSDGESRIQNQLLAGRWK